jgi:hypothetical protein
VAPRPCERDPGAAPEITTGEPPAAAVIAATPAATSAATTTTTTTSTAATGTASTTAATATGTAPTAAAEQQALGNWPFFLGYVAFAVGLNVALLLIMMWLFNVRWRVAS